MLTRLSATRVALTTLISPVLALLLGHAANHEPITPNALAGTLSILSALLLHEYGGRRRRGGRAGARPADAEMADNGNQPALKRPARQR